MISQKKKNIKFGSGNIGPCLILTSPNPKIPSAKHRSDQSDSSKKRRRYRRRDGKPIRRIRPLTTIIGTCRSRIEWYRRSLDLSYGTAENVRVWVENWRVSDSFDAFLRFGFLCFGCGSFKYYEKNILRCITGFVIVITTIICVTIKWNAWSNKFLFADALNLFRKINKSSRNVLICVRYYNHVVGTSLFVPDGQWRMISNI